MGAGEGTERVWGAEGEARAAVAEAEEAKALAAETTLSCKGVRRGVWERSRELIDV